MIELPGLWSLTPIGFGLGVVALFYWLLATGRLIPRASHLRELGVANKRGDEWKDTALSERTTKEALLDQNRALLEGTRTTAAMLRASTPDADFDSTFPTGGV